MSWHRDPSFYNESKYSSPIAIWTTIDKASQNNGNLLVIPKSHKLSLEFTAVPLDLKLYQDSFFNISQLIKDQTVPIILKPGEVIIHSQGLFHASSQRTSLFKDRLAFKILLAPKTIDEYLLSLFNQENTTIFNYKATKEDILLNISKVFQNLLSNNFSYTKHSQYKINLEDYPYNENNIKTILENPTFSTKSNVKFKDYLSLIN